MWQLSCTANPVRTWPLGCDFNAKKTSEFHNSCHRHSCEFTGFHGFSHVFTVHIHDVDMNAEALLEPAQSSEENTDGSLVPVPVRILNIVTQSGRPNLNLGDAQATDDILVRRFMMCDAVSGRESGPGGPGEAYLDGTGYLRVMRWAAHLAVQVGK